MAFEAKLRYRKSHPSDFTVADGTGIEKGTLCKVTDPRTASKSDGTGDKIAGIAGREKISGDGRTRLAMYTDGDWDFSCSGAVVLGNPVMSIGADNHIAECTVGVSGATAIGHALETGADAEVIQVRINIGAGGGIV